MPRSKQLINNRFILANSFVVGLIPAVNDIFGKPRRNTVFFKSAKCTALEELFNGSSEESIDQFVRFELP